MIDPWKRTHDFFVKDLWLIDISSSGKLKADFIQAVRFLVIIVKEVIGGRLPLWAMSFVYTTLLSFVPLLAVGFSVLKAFGVHNIIEPFLKNLLIPLGAKGGELTQRIVGFIDNMRVGVLGVVGLVTLIFTVISLVQKVEEALNAIWRVRTPRSFLRRFSDYLSVILVGPVLVVGAIALTASLMSTSMIQRLVSLEPIGAIVYYTGQLVPYVLVCAAFTFVYIFIPNTKVKLGSAIVGGVLGGVLWETVGWGFASFIVTSTQYAAIYSGFAILILFMMWLYLSWLIVLIGSEASFYYQNPQFLSIEFEDPLRHPRLLEQITVSVMFLVADHFHQKKEPWSVSALSQRLGIEIDPLQEIISALLKKQLIIETASDPPAYLPAREIETISLREVYNTVREPSAGGKGLAAVHPASITEVDRVMERIDEAIENALSDLTLKDLVRSGPGG